MTEMPSYIIHNPKFEPYYKPKKRYYYYSSSSVLSTLFLIFIYTLIFYVFELSPSSIFKDTKVLFFISNTLILIIAVDYRAFTDKESHDFYGEYTSMRSRADNYSPVPVLRYQENPKAVEIKNPEEDESIVKEIVCVSSPPEKTIQMVTKEKPRDHVAVSTEYKEACDARKNTNPKSYGRTKSEKRRRVKKTEDTKARRKSYHRRKSDSLKWENVEEESEEFSKMSNEELNKRVEDFIQRFNRQIRSQPQVSST